MNQMRIVPIVEGHGEVSALPILLRRIGVELLGGVYFDVVKPLRCKRDQVVQRQNNELCQKIDLAVRTLRSFGDGTPGMILVLIDAECDLPCQLGPQLFLRATQCRPDVDMSCVLAAPCYETWFIAAALSLAEYLDLTTDAILPESPEHDGLGKGWIKTRIRRAKYSETSDMPRLTTAMDLIQCRSRSPSFDKLCRELEARLIKN